MTTRPPRTRETDEVITSIRRQIRNSLEVRVGQEDPWALAEVVALKEELAGVEVRTVKRLRDTGYTWDDIGFNLGITGKTAEKRYSRKF